MMWSVDSKREHWWWKSGGETRRDISGVVEEWRGWTCVGEGRDSSGTKGASVW